MLIFKFDRKQKFSYKIYLQYLQDIKKYCLINIIKNFGYVFNNLL